VRRIRPEAAIHARVAGRDAVKVVIAGGGFAGLEAMLAPAALAGPRVAVELVAPDPEFLYRPLAVAQTPLPNKTAQVASEGSTSPGTKPFAESGGGGIRTLDPPNDG
jgi:NADPH-dependent 2,4-dienoyl-CoA reductase/sulfur reductase-like enzyme